MEQYSALLLVVVPLLAMMLAGYRLVLLRLAIEAHPDLFLRIVESIERHEACDPTYRTQTVRRVRRRMTFGSLMTPTLVLVSWLGWLWVYLSELSDEASRMAFAPALMWVTLVLLVFATGDVLVNRFDRVWNL